MTEKEFREFLDQISDCFVVADFGIWERRIILPFTMVTQSGPVVLRNRKDLRVNFDLYIEAAKIMRLDEVYRDPLTLEDCRDGTWIGTYETHLLCKGVRTTEPYTSSALLSQASGSWRMSSILNARGHHPWTKREPGEGIS